MKKNRRIKKLQFESSSNLAYLNYLFSIFWRRPSGYIVAIIYILFIFTIFLVVPKAMGNEPLFIWKLTTFNVPIFSLFFIGAAAGAMAVSIFRISREDGTELSLSAKPLTKGAMVGLKTVVYIILMIGICVVTMLVVTLIKPIYGAYSDTNPNGISDINYKGIILSMLVGSLVNMLFFSGVSIFVSMVGGQVATMIASVGIAFLMVILNFIYGNAVKTPADVISNKYQTTINSYSTYTRKQYIDADPNTKGTSYAAIECYVDDFGEATIYDTNEYWTMAKAQSSSKVVAYLDFGNQLSSLFQGFGLEQSLIDDMAKTQIGSNIAYDYIVDSSSRVGDAKNIKNNDYPIFVYSWNEKQGKRYPCSILLGPTTNDTFGEWYLWSIAYGMEFSSVSAISITQHGYTYPGLSIAKKLDNKVALTLNKLFLTTEQQEEVKGYFDTLYSSGWYNKDYFNKTLTTSPSGIWEGDWKDLSLADKFVANSKLLVNLMFLAQEKEFELIQSYLQASGQTVHGFPFSSTEVTQAYLNDETFRNTLDKFSNFFYYGFSIGKSGNQELYCTLNHCEAPFCETMSNFYKYTIKNIYSVPVLSAIWGSLALALFASAIIVYKKTDFK